MFHTFDTEVATRFGDANIAVLFHNLCYWIAHNRANEKNAHGVVIGDTEVKRHFTFNSIQAFGKQFPYWSEKQIRSYLNKLRENGFIHKTSLNRVGFDRTAWYCLVDEDYWMQKYITEKPEKSERTQPVEVARQEPEEPKDTDGYSAGVSVYDVIVENVRELPEFHGNMQEECINIDDSEISNSSICPNGQIDAPKWANRSDQTGKCICPNGQIDPPKRANAFAQKGEPIPDINSNLKQDLKPDKKTTAATIQNHLQALDSVLILDSAEYEAAAVFLNSNGLDLEYLTWLVENIRPKVKQNLAGYFFSVYRRDSYVNLYHVKNQPQNAHPAEDIIDQECPACGAQYLAIRDDPEASCPECGLTVNPTEEQIEYVKAFLRDGAMDSAMTRLSEIFGKRQNVTDELRALKTDILAKDVS